MALLGFSFSPRVQERTIEAVDSAKGLIGLDSQKPLDPTARLRVYSWQFAREIIADYPLIGAGFGRYAYEINQRGYLTIWVSVFVLIGMILLCAGMDIMNNLRLYQSHLHHEIDHSLRQIDNLDLETGETASRSTGEDAAE